MSEKNLGKPVEESLGFRPSDVARARMALGRICDRFTPYHAEFRYWQADIQEAHMAKRMRGDPAPAENFVPRLHVRGIDGEVFVVPVSGRLAWLARAWRCV